MIGKSLIHLFLSQELLEGIKTVQACNGEQSESKRYEKFLEKAQADDQRGVTTEKIADSTLWFAILAVGPATWFVMSTMLNWPEWLKLERFPVLPKSDLLLYTLLGLSREDGEMLKNFDLSEHLKPGSKIGDVKAGSSQTFLVISLYVFLIFLIAQLATNMIQVLLVWEK